MKEFHKPFVKSLLFIVIATVFAMISSHYIFSFSGLEQKNSEYTYQNSGLLTK